MNKRKIYKPLLATLLLCGLSCDALAEEIQLGDNTALDMVEEVAESTPRQESTEELRKAAQNPVASMISVPFQNNTDFNIGPDNKTKNTLNIQPVWPFELNDD